jgi:hypothetical protein
MFSGIVTGQYPPVCVCLQVMQISRVMFSVGIFWFMHSLVCVYSCRFLEGSSPWGRMVFPRDSLNLLYTLRVRGVPGHGGGSGTRSPQ